MATQSSGTVLKVGWGVLLYFFPLELTDLMFSIGNQYCYYYKYYSTTLLLIYPPLTFLPHAVCVYLINETTKLVASTIQAVVPVK